MGVFHITRRRALLSGLGLGAAAGCASTGEATAARFAHGVASGDPGPDRVVIWTRATPADPAARAVALTWRVTEEADPGRVVAEGAVRAEAANDFCAKVDVTGLAPGTAYRYVFAAGDALSPEGRAKTLPEGRVESLTLAVFSCSNYPFGRFHAYADLAARGADVDAALHLGDYIYESGGPTGWGWAQSQDNGRVHEPQREIVSLEDYRARYAQYRSDADLQAAHAATSWILTWDDHEFTNNPWMHGAQNHNPDQGEGDWETRKAAALRAFFEWMPIRDPEPGRARDAIWRTFAFGDLATLVMLETRLTGRDEQLDYGRDLGWIETGFRADAEGRMRALDPDQLIPTPPPDTEIRRTPFDVTGPEPRPILDYDRVVAIDPEAPPPGVAFLRDVDAFRARLDDPDRRMIDPAQEAWLVDTVAAAEEAGVRWQVLGNQIIFARMPLFDFARYYDAGAIARLSENGYIAGQMEMGRYGLPANLDAWDGYPAQRDRIADAFSQAGAHPVFVTGDTHVFWANEINDAAGARCAAEFGTTGVTSPGFADDYAGVEPPITEVMAGGYPGTRHVDPDGRGYLLVTFGRDQAVCEMIATSAPDEPETRSHVAARWVQRRRDAEGRLPPLERG